MAKYSLLILLLTFCTVLLCAEDFPLRQATDVRWEGMHVRTTDNCEVVFCSDAVHGDMDVYAQKIAPNGQAVWPEALPIVLKPGDQQVTGVVKTSDNNIIVLWREYEIDTTLGYCAQKISSNGQRLWAENGVDIYDGGMELRNAIPVANSVGGAFVIFQYGYGGNYVLGQNLDALGNQLWESGGLVLASYSGYISLDQAISDGEGGVIINYNYYQNSQYMNRLLRISPTGSIVGSDPLMPVGSFPGYSYKIMPGNNGEYILYNISGESEPYIRLSKIDNMGAMLLPQTVTYPLSSYEIWDTFALDCYPDGGVAFAWKSNLEGESHWRVQRFSNSFVPQWQESGVEFGVPSDDGDNLSLSVGSNDLLWLVWDIYDQYGESREVKAQVVSATGVPGWELTGKTLSGGYGEPIVIAYPDRAMFAWNPQIEGRESMRRQVCSSGGANFLGESEEVIIQRLAGQAYLSEVIAFNEKYLSLWTDERTPGQIYYQLSNQNMEPLLEENGRALNSPAEQDWASVVSAQRLGENKVAVLYSKSDAGSSHYCLQVLDANGNSLYPGDGIAFYDINTYTTNIAMSTLGDDIYLAWRYYDGSYNYPIRGQRISNGERMWGENGRVIAILDDDVYSVTLNLQGRYFIWSESNNTTNTSTCKALLVMENGDPAGWDAQGVPLIAEGEATLGYGSSAGIIDGNLVVLFSHLLNSTITARAQKINPSGERMWGANGIALDTPPQHSWTMDALFGDEVSCLIMEDYDELRQIRAQRISASGELLWGESGTLITTNLNNCYDAKLLKYANGSYSCVYSDNDGAWIQNRDVFIRNINPQGEPMGEGVSVLCGARYQQDNVQAAALGNSALVAWSDDRAGIINSEVAMTGVWGTRIVSEYVPADDPLESAPALIALDGNYPNPFNPSTTISFSLGEPQSVSMDIYNLKGQLVRILLSAADLPSGKHSVVWNGCDESGNSVSSGIYFCRVSSAETSVVRKMLLSK